MPRLQVRPRARCARLTENRQWGYAPRTGICFREGDPRQAGFAASVKGRFKHEFRLACGHPASFRRSCSCSSSILAVAIVQLLAVCSSARGVIVRDLSDPSRAGSAFRLDAPPIFELPVALSAGVPVTFETRNPSPGADPVLHLLAPLSHDGPVSQVAWDDDGAGNPNARLTYTPTAAGTYLLVMRATWNGRSGSVQLYKDGRQVWTSFPAGGAFKRIENLRGGESLTTLPLPRGPRLHVAYVLDERGRLLERYTSGASEAIIRSYSARPLQILMAAPVWPDVPGPIRLVRNDASLSGHDPDHDGLGTELEANVGTCSALTGGAGRWDCTRSADARDTDGDGLTDGAELLGVLDEPPYQLLPRWGADPRHKDLFLEVDFMMRSRDERPQRLSREVAMEMARIYGDRETDPLLRLFHAQSLGNPDLEPGVRLHLDTGVTPPASAPEAEHEAYGDWGGASIVQPVCDGDQCRGADAQDVWRREMHESRRGLFHYALAYPDSGGQAPYHSVAFNLPMLDAGTAAHELGHNFGLGHGGPEGDGLDVKANCKANYPSVMSYAYLDRGWGHFSDGYGRNPMSNTRLMERGAVPNASSAAGRRYLEALRDFFEYNVDLTAGHVDWNRDGVFSDGAVSAYSNNNGSGCQMTRNNVVPIHERSRLAPALTRIGDMTLAFYLDEQGSLQFAYTLDSLACPQAAPVGCGSPMTLRYVQLPWNRGIQAFDAHRIRRGSDHAVLVAYRDIQGRLFEVIFTRSNLAWSEPRRVQTVYPAIEDVSLAGDDQLTYLAYRAGDGTALVKARPASTGQWEADVAVRDPAGALIRIAPGNSPALLLAPMPAGSRTLFGLFPVWEQGALKIYAFDPAARRWSLAAWQPREEPTFGRPALAYAPVAPDSPLPGRLYLLWMRRSSDANNVVRETMLTARMTRAGVVPEFGFHSDHDNTWFYGYGIDLLFEPGVDSNLRSLISVKPYKNGVLQPPVLELRPKADGIVDIELRDANDWEVLRVDLCRTLVASGSSGLRCPDWAW